MQQGVIMANGTLFLYEILPRFELDLDGSNGSDDNNIMDFKSSTKLADLGTTWQGP